ncbi:4-hydroxy-3-methylbut-2-enyl diphosphate reductase [PVC group bacterium (ex Bugula neritina AB1)]|nr:4-hydroxy-3-methylbut-2-enyl diphosphate reductase [PVC group bacterium (ex Bugula neritina AB1)]
MQVTKAVALGTCFGVRDAIDLALESENKKDLTILGQLVHNPQTVLRLEEQGIRNANKVEDIETKYVMITAHGASNKVKEEVLNRGHILEDASCPLVVRVHKAIKKMVKDGYFPVVIGQESHVEVRGIVGDLKDYEVIGSIKDVEKIEGYPRLGIVSQTTQPIKNVLKIVEAIKEQKHEDIKFVDTVCKPTKDRQKAVEDLCSKVDIVMVVGGFNSSNTKKLKLVCEKKGLRCHHIEGVQNIKEEWFYADDHVGITAGTSTPSDVIEKVYEYLCSLEVSTLFKGTIS